MKREELLKSREYWINHIQLGLFELIEEYRAENKISKTQLAQELGVSKSYITQVLNGDFDHKISKLVDLALAFGKVPVIRYEDINQHIEDDRLGITVLSMNSKYSSFDINIKKVSKKKRYSSYGTIRQFVSEGIQNDNFCLS